MFTRINMAIWPKNMSNNIKKLLHKSTFDSHISETLDAPRREMAATAMRDIVVCIECRRFHYGRGWHDNLPERIIRSGSMIKAVYAVCHDCKERQNRNLCPTCRVLYGKRGGSNGQHD